MQKQPDISSVKRPQVMYVRYARRAWTKRRRIITGIITGLVVLLIAAGVWYKVFQSQSFLIDGSKYQAVFVSNNQVYFGKLQHLSDGSYSLTNVYYLQQAANTSQKPNSSDQTPQLVKMGSELHGPDDRIVFAKDQVLFWENLKTDGKVAKAIEDYLKK